MKKYIIGGVIGAGIATFLVIMALGIANYYTCFAYNLPHRPAIIEIAPQDTIVEVHPEFIIVPEGFNATKISGLRAP